MEVKYKYEMQRSMDASYWRHAPFVVIYRYLIKIINQIIIAKDYKGNGGENIETRW